VVLLHAFPLNRAMWGPQVEALRDRFTVITPDLRGFGESDVPGGPLSMDDYAGDVLALLDSLGYGSFILGGCSMGGYAAFRVVALAAYRVRALIIADSRAEPDTDEAREKRQASIAQIEAEGPQRFLDELTPRLVGPTTMAGRPSVLAGVREIIGAPHPRTLTAALAAMAGRPDSRPLLGTITVPALVVVGEEDDLTPPASSEAMSAGLPHARLEVISGAGHLSGLEAPEAFNRALQEFLAAL
jgi:pimeloyl-ACP methyl ester carboxylesterase